MPCPSLGDWEDLCAFTVDGQSYLLIADIGDNLRWRRVLTLYILREPQLQELADGTILEVERTIQFGYPDGPRDSEAAAVDTTSREILILSKRVIPAEVYRLPLEAPEDRIVTAERIALLTGIPQPTERDHYESPTLGKMRSWPTALDIHGHHAVIVTLKDAYLFERLPGAILGRHVQRDSTTHRPATHRPAGSRRILERRAAHLHHHGAF